MRIGYPCMNTGIGCTSARTFRLKSWSEERFLSTVAENLSCLSRILAYNAAHELLFFRVTSDLVPFASHPVNILDWPGIFAEEFAGIGAVVRENGMRVSMHPDQFTLINSPDEGVRERSVAELAYHAAALDAMGLDTTAKVQVHVGGVYGDREAAMERFVERYRTLPGAVGRRLVVENDDRLYTVRDCLALHRACGVPVVFDVFHHECNSSGEDAAGALAACAATWDPLDDGPLMVDYSSQAPGARRGRHAAALDPTHFAAFLAASRPHDFDLMLEVKDKEQSALRARALALAAGDPRVRRGRP
ncbi:UV DNA damage repair endonuclease UvsE [Methanofollis formosanus]|uniref:UV DNA damage repair endonuclease UvsE n=1 Tax=Methanofollis formosanus TaxID=299308 RepID=A0A8G1EH90_9EURY|nr:UV DNA damage repair endonuclease UvsE [Methanofollis formosanus]QYZ79994.1 UV DNA damage repair endonuclease UvsE [Methanofollis formosanus]